MCELENSTEVFALAHLPVGRSDSVNYSLELVFDRKLSKGQFLYRGEPLRMTRYCKENRRSQGYTNRKKRAFKKFRDLEWIPCEQLARWLKYPPECYDERDNFGCEYQVYREEGFTFDADTNTWRNSWYYRQISAVYHTTHREEIEFKLELDLKNRTGSYIYYSCRSTED
jgi:hypothetical protein